MAMRKLRDSIYYVSCIDDITEVVRDHSENPDAKFDPRPDFENKIYPAIVSVNDSICDFGTVLIVTEYVEYRDDLEQFLNVVNSAPIGDGYGVVKT